ncbi:MAG: hypothetical protein QME35_07240 [Thermoanaerobacteraceae bacterium]|nr:hypothetical protein [Thermoanaerobacteraceae bacterium]
MNINLECIYCIIKKSDSLFTIFEKDERKKFRFMKEVFANEKDIKVMME